MSENQSQVKLVGKTGNYAGSEFLVTGGEFTIGRNPDNDLVMDEKTLSANHSKIVRSNDRFEVHDLNSTNGTYVNGKQVTHAPLRSEDIVRFDIYEFTFHDESQVARTVVSSAPQFEEKPEQHTVTREPTIQAEPAPQPQPQAAAPASAEAAPAAAPKASAPKATPAHFEPTGNLMLGLIIGLIFGLGVACGGFILSSVMGGAVFQIFDVVKIFFTLTSILYTHVFWTNITEWNLEAVIVLVSVILGPIIGGMLTQLIGKTNRFATAFLFSLFFVVIALVTHISVLGFKFDMLTMQMAGSNMMGIYDGWMALAVMYGYFFGVTFVLSFIGTLFSRR